MTVDEATRRYEKWLGQHMPLVSVDLEKKHAEMERDLFCFMRATFYRWCQHWRRAAESKQAFRVLAVGDLHVENFGTWRDAEGRLIWGVNDFDEAARLAWTNDLVRLATSVQVAIVCEHLSLNMRDASAAILEGYAEGLAQGGHPFVLEEEHRWLRRVATGKLRDPVAFWSKMDVLPPARAANREVVKLLGAAMPAAGMKVRVCRRSAGLGSLGRPRFVGIADWSGGRIAREVKALAPSAWSWATGAKSRAIYYQDIVSAAVRMRDPILQVAEGWVTRRLAPHCARIELADLPDERNECRLLHAMGFETANIHLGTRHARRRITRELRHLGPRRLQKLAGRFAQAIEDDWRAWRARGAES